MSASLTDMLTTHKNVVTALNGEVTMTLNLAGSSIAPGLAVQTLVSPVAGRVMVISVIAAGTTTGLIHDANSIVSATNLRRIMTVPMAVGVYRLDMPVAYGIVFTPGTGMVVAISYSSVLS
jgi:hypothetical protein